MNDWIRQQISLLRERFYDTLHWVRRWILVLRERYYNAPHNHQVLMIISWLIILSLPVYLFVSISLIGPISLAIFISVWFLDYLWQDRYPALKRWIREIEYGENDVKDPYCNKGLLPPWDEKLLPPSSIGQRVFRISGRLFSRWQSHQLSKWQSLQLFEQLYVLAFMILIVGFVSFRIHGNPTKVFYGSLLLGYGVSSIGFGLWLSPWLQRIWHWRLGKLALTLLHGGVLLLSIIPARLLVAEALGLPPQDFNVTVGICTLLFYLPLWLLVFELLVIPFVLIYFVLSALFMFTTYFPVNDLLLLLARLFPTVPRLRLFLEHNREKFIWHGFMHMFGMVGIALGIMLFAEWYSHVMRSLQPMVRAVAYSADFQQVSLYPGADVNRRLRLHENGVISYAEKCGVVTRSSDQVDFFQIPLIIGHLWLRTFFPDICISVEKMQ